MTAMPHLPSLSWDFADRLQAVGLVGGTASYVYDAAGQRVRKVDRVAERHPPQRADLPRRLRDLPRVRRRTAPTCDSSARRCTSWTTSSASRWSRPRRSTTASRSTAPVPLQRYQLGNHLGSASVELDADGALISYEEYHPYGTTAFQAGRSAAETSSSAIATPARSATRRAGSPTTARGTTRPGSGGGSSADPARLAAGMNLFAYASAQPDPARGPDRVRQRGHATGALTNEFEVLAIQARSQEVGEKPAS